MALNSIDFKSDEELLHLRDKVMTPESLYGHDDTKNINSDLPVDIDNGFNPTQPLFQPFIKPDLRNKKTQSPGFFETLGHSFSENNEIFEAGRFVSSSLEHANALHDEVPSDWTPYTLDALQGMDAQKYGSYIFDAVSPHEQEARRQHVFDKMRDEEYYNDGSIVAKFIGGGLGAVTGPSMALFPLSATLKYAKAGQNIIQNILRTAPELALQSTAHNAFMEGTKIGGNTEDFVVNSLRDATAAIVLTGGAAAFGSVVSGGKLYNARQAINLNHEGFDVKFRVGIDGKVDEAFPYEAYPLPGVNASAMQVKASNDFINSRMAKEGLFKLIPGLDKAAGYLSPVTRMLNHSYLTTSQFANRLFDHSIITKGLAAGQTAKDNFERIMWDISGNTKQMGWMLEGLRAEANGIQNGGAADKAMKSLTQRMSKGPAFDKEQFGSAVSNVIRTGEQHDNKSVNEAANFLNQHLTNTYSRFLKAHGLSEDILSPRTAVDYLMRNYNQDMLVQRPGQWSDVVSSALKEQDELIESLVNPIANQEQIVNRYKDAILSNKGKSDLEIKTQSKTLESHQAELSRLKNELDERMRDDESLHILLQERNFMSASDVREMKELFKPVRQQELKIEKIKSELDAVRKQRNTSKQQLLKAKTDKTKTNHSSKFDAHSKNIDRLEQKLREMENEVQDMQASINGRAMNGEINQRLFTRNPKTNIVEFRKISSPKFRAVYEDDSARIQAAMAYRETIMNSTPEQLGRQMLGTLSSGNLENPLGVRSLMIPDSVLQSGGFLSNDLTRNVSVYDLVLGKKTAFKEAFQGFGVTGNEDGIIGVTNQLQEEWRIKESQIAAMPADKQAKAYAKNNKEFKNATALIKKAYDHAMGNGTRSRGQRMFSKGVRDFSVATRLGSVPLTMITDIGGVFLNNSFIEVLRDGLLPMVKTVNGKVKNSQGAAYHESASHLSIAMEHMGNAYMDKAWNSSTMADVSVGGKLSNGLEGLAHLSGNLFGTNYMDNFMQRMAANVTQSKVMKYMHDFKEGNLSSKNELSLKRLGIDPAEWSDRFIDSYKRSGGETNGFGGYYSKYYVWQDQQAMLKMSNAIRSGVRASVLKKGLGDAPFWTNDPLWGLFSHLKGWMFSAFTRYTVPMMQRMDAEKALGLGVMLMTGSMVDPLRAWTRGEEYDFEDKAKFGLAALNNSGALGIITDVVQDLNALTGGELLPKMQSDRYRNRSIVGIAGGPLAGMADDIVNVVASVVSGKANQQDMNKFVRLVPLSQAWYLRFLSNKLVEAMDLPKNRASADGWFD